MIVVDASALRAYLAGSDPAVAAEMDRAAGETWLCSPLALAAAFTPVAAFPEALSHAQRVLREIGLHETPLASRVAVPMARLAAEGGLSLDAASTLLLAEERDASVLSVDPVLRVGCARRGISVRPARISGA